MMQRRIVGLTLTLIFTAISCQLEPDDSFDDTRRDFRANTEITGEPLATTWGWTEFTSEEDPPIICDGSSMVGGFGCRRGYCGDARLYCSTTIHTGYGTYWTSYFSEETGVDSNFRRCHEDYWMVGLACSGPYCDELSIACRYFPSASPHGCRWTGWISEEGGGSLYFGAGYYARGVRCSGRYCDNKRFYVCRT